MEETSPRSAVIGPGAALALAVGAVVSFGAVDAAGSLGGDAESLVVLLWIVGWVLLAWAVIVAGGCLAALLRRALARRPVSGSEVALLGACVALVVLAVSMHPLWGAGSGSGG